MHHLFTVTIHKLKVHLQRALPFPNRPGQFPSFWLAPWMKFLRGRSSSFLPCTRRSVLACLPRWSHWMANASCRTVLQGHQNDDQSDVWHLQHKQSYWRKKEEEKRLESCPLWTHDRKVSSFRHSRCRRLFSWRLTSYADLFHMLILPSCYRRNAGVRLQLSTHAPCKCGFKWSGMVISCAKNVHWNGISFIWHQPYNDQIVL